MHTDEEWTNLPISLVCPNMHANLYRILHTNHVYTLSEVYNFKRASNYVFDLNQTSMVAIFG